MNPDEQPPCGGYIGRFEPTSGLKHYNYAGEVIGFWDAIDFSNDGHHYQPALTEVQSAWGPARVSTICPGFDFSFGNPYGVRRQPVLFETMAFGHDTNPYDQAQVRSLTLDRALMVHHAVADELAQSWWTNLGGRA